MTAQYSILKVSLNELLGDEVSVGLFIDTGDLLWFEYSEEELTKVKKIMPVGVESLEAYLKAIKSSVASRRSRDYSPIQIHLNKNYATVLSHLSSTYNNILKITKPKPVVLGQNNDDEFTKFYNELFKISSDIPVKTEKHESKKIVRENLIQPLNDIVHTDVVMSKVFPELFFSTKIDCIGKNGSYIAAKHIDFEMGFQTVDTHFSHYNILLDYINRTKEEDCKAFIIAVAPADNAVSSYHKLWDFINNDDKFTIKAPQQSSEVVDSVLRSNATKFAEVDSVEDDEE